MAAACSVVGKASIICVDVAVAARSIYVVNSWTLSINSRCLVRRNRFSLFLDLKPAGGIGISSYSVRLAEPPIVVINVGVSAVSALSEHHSVQVFGEINAGCGVFGVRECLYWRILGGTLHV